MPYGGIHLLLFWEMLLTGESEDVRRRKRSGHQLQGKEACLRRTAPAYCISSDVVL